MCYHKRIVFSCKHFGFGSEVRPCSLQSNYNQGLSNIPCDTMNAHPLHSISVEVVCKKCERNKVATASVMLRTKLLLKDLRETLARQQLLLKEDDPKLAELYERLSEGSEVSNTEVEVEADK